MPFLPFFSFSTYCVNIWANLQKCAFLPLFFLSQKKMFETKKLSEHWPRWPWWWGETRPNSLQLRKKIERNKDFFFEKKNSRKRPRLSELRFLSEREHPVLSKSSKMKKDSSFWRKVVDLRAYLRARGLNTVLPDFFARNYRETGVIFTR